MSFRRLLSAVPVLAFVVSSPVARLPPPAHAADAVPQQPGGGQMLVIENAGQFDPAVRFQVQARGMTLWVAEDSLWISKLMEQPWPGPADGADPTDRLDSLQKLGARRGVNLKITFLGRRNWDSAVGTGGLATRMNYFLGSDPDQWRSGVRTYAAVSWPDLHPGISVTLTAVGGRAALVVEADPGGDISALRLQVEGAEGFRVSNDCRVAAETAIGSVVLPEVFTDGRRLTPNVRGTEVSFSSGPCGQPPPIPHGGGPTTGPGRGLIFGTFLGGSENEYVSGLATGGDGSMYVAGLTYSPDFPTTPGAFDRSYDDDEGFGGDAFVSRLDPTGATLMYSTFLGGGSGDAANSLALGPDGSAYVGGSTGSPDFPTTPGAFDTTYGHGDAFVTKLDPQGAALTYSTFLGGSSVESIQAITLGADGTVHATGETHSSDFPTTPGAYDPTQNGESDAFVSALNATGTDLIYSTYLGAGYNDVGYGIVVGPGDTAYVTGRAQSRDFPTTPGAYDETFNGGNNDLFVTRLDAQGGSLVFSTYVGGNDHDDGNAIALDAAGNVYVVGFTDSPNYPTTPGAYDQTANGSADAFVTKLNPTGSALVYSTFLGGNDTDAWADLLLDADGTLTLTGYTYSADFPTTPGAYDRVRDGSAEAFVARFDPTGSLLLYSTFLGGTHQVIDVGAAIAPAAAGAVSVAGRTHSADFPTTPGAFDRSHAGEFDAFVATLRVAPTPTWRR